MIDLLSFYSFAFVIVGMAALSLSLAGEHTLPRGHSLEIFTLAQFALLGHLVANIWTEHSGLCLLISAIFYLTGKYIIQKFRIHIKIDDPLIISFYLILTSAQYLIINTFPGLDAHLSVGVFGSIVTSSYYENILMLIIFTICLFILISRRNIFLKHTIEKALLKANCFHLGQELVIITILVTSLFGLGILYTLSFLLIPWVFFGQLFQNQKNALMAISLTNICASIMGLYFSIAFDNLGTTPTQVILLSTFSIVIYFKMLRTDSFIKSK